MTWKISGYDFENKEALEPLYLPSAYSFDEAIAEARKTNRWYSTGQLVREK